MNNGTNGLGGARGEPVIGVEGNTLEAIHLMV